MSTIDPSEFIPALASPREDVGRYARQLLGIPADAELLPHLVEWLTGDSPAARAAAATGLGHLADEAAELPLLEVLGDPASEVRAAAALALGAIMPQGYAPLTPALNVLFATDPDDRVRAAAIAALGRIDRPQEFLNLVLGRYAILSDHDPGVRYQAAHALRRYGVLMAVPELVEVIRRDPGERVRIEAIRACAAMQASGAVDAIAAALADGPEAVQQAAAEALGHLGGDAAVDALVEAARNRRHPLLRAVIEILATLKDARAVPVLAVLLGELHTGTRLMAARALGEVGGPAAVDALLDALGEPVEEVQDAVMSALGRTGDARAVPALSELARSAGSHRARGAIRALGSIGGREAIGPLLNVLEHGPAERRGDAAEALAAIGSPSAAPYLMAALRGVGSIPGERIAGALRGLGIAMDVSEYAAELSHETAWVRIRAAMVLGYLGGREHVPLLVRAIADEHAGLEALEALGRLGGGEALDAIRETLLTDEREMARSRAAWALRRHGGEAVRASLELAARDDAAASVRGTARESLDYPGRGERQK